MTKPSSEFVPETSSEVDKTITPAISFALAETALAHTQRYASIFRNPRAEHNIEQAYNDWHAIQRAKADLEANPTD